MDFLSSSSTGGFGGLSNQDLQDGAAAAATAGRPVGGVGKCHSPDPPGKTYQCAAGPNGCPSGLCFNCSQLCGPFDEDALTLALHPPPHPPAGLLVEKLGRSLGVYAPCAAAPGMTRLHSAHVALVTTRNVTVAAVCSRFSWAHLEAAWIKSKKCEEEWRREHSHLGRTRLFTFLKRTFVLLSLTECSIVLFLPLEFNQL